MASPQLLRTSACALLFCLFGCAGGAALEEQDDSALHVSADLDPDPPSVARHTMILHIDDDAGDAVVGAEVSARTEMPLHGHASNETAEVSETAPGRYQLFPVTFNMPGQWQVLVDVTVQGEHASRTFTYEVE